jgi:Protein of unknown function (DUF3631)
MGKAFRIFKMRGDERMSNAKVVSLQKRRAQQGKDVADVAGGVALRGAVEAKENNGVADVALYGEVGAILDDIVTFYREHLVMPEGAAEAAALWCVFSHALDCFQHNPRLAFISPVFGCGKTTAIAITSGLVPKPQVVSNTTAAPVYRMIEQERPTLLFDEADTYMHGEDGGLRGILNSGHNRTGAYVMRCGGKNYEKPKRFSTWTPMVIARIGKLWETLESRSIVITMQRKRKHDRVKDFVESDRTTRKRLETLARRITGWVAKNKRQLEGAKPQMPACLFNRAENNWRPLLAIADCAGDDWPERARRAAEQLSGNQEDPTREIMLLQDCKRAFGADLKIHSKALVDFLNALETRPWGEMNNGQGINQNKLASMLAPFGITSDDVRIGEKVKKGYRWQDFGDAWERYLASEPEIAPTGAGEITPPGFPWTDDDAEVFFTPPPRQSATSATLWESEHLQGVSGHGA